MSDARDNSMTYEYDSLNRQTKMVYADSTFSSTTYDALGRATAKGRGQGLACKIAICLFHCELSAGMRKLERKATVRVAVP